MNKIFIYAREILFIDDVSICFLTWLQSCRLLTCSAVFLLFKIWKKPAKNCLVFQSSLSFYVLIQERLQNKAEFKKHSQVVRFANLSEDHLQQILAERHSLGTEKTAIGH